MQQILTDKLSEADFGYCVLCNQVVGERLHPFWGVAKSVALHEKGTGHKRHKDIKLYRTIEDRTMAHYDETDWY